MSTDDFIELSYPLIFDSCYIIANVVNITQFELSNAGVLVCNSNSNFKYSYFIRLNATQCNFAIYDDFINKDAFNSCFFYNITANLCSFFSVKLITISECSFLNVNLVFTPNPIDLYRCNLFNCILGKAYNLINCTNESISNIQADLSFIKDTTEKLSLNETYINHKEPITTLVYKHKLIVDKCCFQNILNKIELGTCILCRDTLHSISITNSIFHQIENIYVHEVAPSTICVFCYFCNFYASNNCYFKSTGTFLLMETAEINPQFSGINQTSICNLNSIEIEKFIIELHKVPFILNANISNGFQQLLLPATKFSSRYSNYCNNTIQNPEFRFLIFVDIIALYHFNCFSNLKFAEHADDYVYSIFFSQIGNRYAYLNFSSNIVSEIDEKAYLLNVYRLAIYNNTFQKDIKIKYENLTLNESNVYTDNVVLHINDFPEYKLPESHLAVYIIVLISISVIALIPVLVLISYILYRKKVIRVIESEIILKATIVDDFG